MEEAKSLTRYGRVAQMVTAIRLRRIERMFARVRVSPRPVESFSTLRYKIENDSKQNV